MSHEHAAPAQAADPFDVSSDAPAPRAAPPGEAHAPARHGAGASPANAHGWAAHWAEGGSDVRHDLLRTLHEARGVNAEIVQLSNAQGVHGTIDVASVARNEKGMLWWDSYGDIGSTWMYLKGGAGPDAETARHRAAEEIMRDVASRPLGREIGR